MKHKITLLDFDLRVVRWAENYLRTHPPGYGRVLAVHIEKNDHLDSDAKFRAMARHHSDDVLRDNLAALPRPLSADAVMGVVRKHNQEYQIHMTECELCDSRLSRENPIFIISLETEDGYDVCMCRACLAALPGRIDATTPTAY